MNLTTTHIKLNITLKNGTLIRGTLYNNDPIFEKLLSSCANKSKSEPNLIGILTPDLQGTIFIRPQEIAVIEVNQHVIAVSDTSRKLNDCPVVIDDFLGRDTQDYLLEYVVAKEHEFKESTITNPKTGEDF
ncbi:hypothetical protein VZ95_18825, partial [Elstera litoralis]